MAQKNSAKYTYLDCDGLTDSIVLIAVMTNIASLNQERFINVISAIIKPHWLQERSLRERNSRFVFGFWLFTLSRKRKMAFQHWSCPVSWVFLTTPLGE